MRTTARCRALTVAITLATVATGTTTAVVTGAVTTGVLARIDRGVTMHTAVAGDSTLAAAALPISADDAEPRAAALVRPRAAAAVHSPGTLTVPARRSSNRTAVAAQRSSLRASERVAQRVTQRAGTQRAAQRVTQRAGTQRAVTRSIPATRPASTAAAAARSATVPASAKPAGGRQTAAPSQTAQAGKPRQLLSLTQGQQVVAVYVALAEAPDDPAIVAGTRALKRAGYVGHVRDLGCDRGAGEALHLDPSVFYFAEGVYFATAPEARRFTKHFPRRVVGTASVKVYCLD